MCLSLMCFLRTAFRYISRRGLRSMKRFVFDHVYREAVAGYQPKVLLIVSLKNRNPDRHDGVIPTWFFLFVCLFHLFGRISWCVTLTSYPLTRPVFCRTQRSSRCSSNNNNSTKKIIKEKLFKMLISQCCSFFSPLFLCLFVCLFVCFYVSLLLCLPVRLPFLLFSFFASGDF